MKFRRALPGILLTIIVCMSMLVGLTAISKIKVDTSATVGFQHDIIGMAGEDPTVPTWDKVNHTMISIDTSEAPRASVNYTGVAGVVASWLPPSTFNKKASINATNMQPNIYMNYTDRYSINCTQVVSGSNYTVKLIAPSIYFRLKGMVIPETNWKSIKLGRVGNWTSFTFGEIGFDSRIYPSIWPNVTQYNNGTDLPEDKHYFKFNVSHAAKVFYNRNVQAGDSFFFELNYTIQIVTSEWSMSSTSTKNFRIEGNQSTRSANLTLGFRISGPKGVNVTFHYKPADDGWTGNFNFYRNNILLPKPDKEAQGWKLPKTGTVDLNSTGVAFKIEFNYNATVGFVERHVGKWNSDGIASRLDTRTRTYKLAVLSGPQTLLVERVEFTANDIAFRSVFQISKKVAPSSSIALSDDTYSYYDPVLEKEVTKSNGTKVVVGRIQQANGPVAASFNYNASYSVSLRVLDEIRNPLPGAEVTLYFHGIRFGPLMSLNKTYLQPAKIANTLGFVSYDYLPEGNYSVEVRFQGRLVKTQEFALYGTTNKSTIEVITDVPYPPGILVSWIAIFGLLCMLGIALFKRKR
ncbi:MAG: hypothetical protein Q6373_006275 [Candidatus Sigynarchaeota archaeon]